jgi:type IV pilus assembly protein PilB
MVKKLGEILVDAGLIDDRQLGVALRQQSKSGGRLGEVLADLGFTNDDEISRALAEQAGIDHVELDGILPAPEAVEHLPEATARKLNVLPLRLEEAGIVVAMANVTDIVAIDEIQRETGLFAQIVSCSHRQLLRAIDRVYDGTNSHEGFIEEIAERALEEVGEADASASSGALVELVEQLVATGVRRSATDVHVQPDRSVLRIRYRIDGDLCAGTTLRLDLLGAIVSRIKVLATLDISETRVPQDGKFRFPFETTQVDMRVSTFPTVYGESVVLRILDRDRQSFDLAALGLDPRQQEILERGARLANGMVLAVGPTGSGKSTTLYGLLRSVDAAQRKIITVEDPVEYEMALATQCQVNEKAGLTFAAGLRAILRHDPDVILIGEMRDEETASLAVRAALTGHLVFSTLHTNDAVRTISRLVDMGVDAFLVSSCLAVISAQRLVRKICSLCRRDVTPTPDQLRAAGLAEDAAGRFAEGAGCDACSGSGVRGREALFELLEVTPTIADLISTGATNREIERAACEAGFVPFREAAAQRAAEGRISLAEAARVAAEV